PTLILIACLWSVGDRFTQPYRIYCSPAVPKGWGACSQRCCVKLSPKCGNCWRFRSHGGRQPPCRSAILSCVGTALSHGDRSRKWRSLTRGSSRLRNKKWGAPLKGLYVSTHDASVSDIRARGITSCLICRHFTSRQRALGKL